MCIKGSSATDSPSVRGRIRYLLELAAVSLLALLYWATLLAIVSLTLVALGVLSRISPWTAGLFPRIAGLLVAIVGIAGLLTGLSYLTGSEGRTTSLLADLSARIAVVTAVAISHSPGSPATATTGLRELSNRRQEQLVLATRLLPSNPVATLERH